MHEALVQAGKEYFNQRETYHKAFSCIKDFSDESSRKFAFEALQTHVRSKFRGISSKLTKKMGCQLTCVPENYTEAVEIEHAVPLNLIHDHILGIKGKGVGFKSATDYILKESEDIQAYVAIFVVGVWVTKVQHSKLNARSMHQEFDMTANLDAWNVNELSLKN